MRLPLGVRGQDRGAGVVSQGFGGPAVKDGKVDEGSVMSGQIAGIVCKEQSAKDIIEDLFKDAEGIYAARRSNFVV